MPDGRLQKVTIKRPVEIEEKAQVIISAGYSFEIEMLSDYSTISMEVCDPVTEEVLSGAICHNGPTEDGKLGVPESVDKIVREAFNALHAVKPPTS